MFEDFFRTEIVFRRTNPAAAVRRLLQMFENEDCHAVCVSMSMTAAYLEEWRDHGPSKDWIDWERSSYWLKITDPKQFYHELNRTVKSDVLEIYRSVSIISSDIYLLKLNGIEYVRAVDVLDFWEEIGDLQFRE